MTNDFKYLYNYVSCEDCSHYVNVPALDCAVCGRVFRSLGVVKLVDDMRFPCRLFVLSLPGQDRIRSSYNIPSDVLEKVGLL